MLSAGVVILEDWEFRSSSPYPASHRHLSLPSLLAVFSSVPVLSIPKMSERERERFLSLRTFVSTLSQGGLEEFTRAELRVDCGSYGCVSINRQCAPLSLVEDQRGSALIGRELHSVATPVSLMP